MSGTVTTRLLQGFTDPSFPATDWETLLSTGATDAVFLTWHWQKAWWETFGRGELLLILAERNSAPVALAPLFTEAGMVYFVGSGGSDYLDFVGSIESPEVLEALLLEARRRVAEFIGFVFYHVPEQSGTGARLQDAAQRLGLKCFDEDRQVAPLLEAGAEGRNAIAAANKQSLVRGERAFTRDAPIAVEHVSTSEKILPHLEDFFAQHLERWAATPSPSLFRDEKQKEFYRCLVRTAGDTGWLRFTRLEWRERAIAFHFGFYRGGVFLWYKPTFAIEFADRSPGSVLLRHLLLRAAEEKAAVFDFGLGDEPFKSRFASRTTAVHNWGLYDPAALQPKNSTATP